MENRYQIGDVCQMVGVKPHVLRYWEKEIPLVAPRKSLSGHREYTFRDIELLNRIRHLVYERGFTLAGVRNQLWQEAGEEFQDAKASISALRAQLIHVLELVRSERNSVNHAAQSADATTDEA